MVYQYVACNEKGEMVKGRLSAASEEAANELLAYAGYRTIALKAHVPFLSLAKLSASLYQVRLPEIILFYRQLAMLLESGINIATSLELLQEQTGNRLLKKVLTGAITDVRGGNQLSTALGKYPKVFPPVYTRLLGVGERSGELETVLRQVADYMEKEATTAKQTKSALMYPIITVIVTIAVLALLMTFILPAFAKLYSTMGTELPPVARILVTLSDIVQSYGMYAFLAVAVIIGIVILYVRTPGGRYKWDKLLLRLPLIGRVRHLTELARSCRNVSLMFRAGLPLSEAVLQAIQGCNNKVMARALLDVQQDMLKGEGIAKPMAKNKLFLPMMVQMVSVGEETGNLDTTLIAVARSYEAEAEDKMRSFIGLLQPAMTVFLGLVIGIVALALFQTIYGMGEKF